MKALLLAYAVGAHLACLALCHRSLRQIDNRNDVNLLNFALNMEYLQAELYSCAATGQPIPDDLRGGGPASTGCQAANLTDDGLAIATNLANNEIDHVRYLRRVLGDSAVAIPELNIGSAFADAANVAYDGQTLDPPFSPYTDDTSLWSAAFLLEDVGVTSLQGIIMRLSNPDSKLVAVNLVTPEGYHGGLIRTLLFGVRAQQTPLGDTVSQQILKFALLRGKLGAGNGQGLETEGTSNGEGANLVAADSATNRVSFYRAPDGVARILTLAGSGDEGGFFPQGLNGGLSS